MPFGLTNAPATFQRTLYILLSTYKWKTCLAYLDKVIIFPMTLKTISVTSERYWRYSKELASRFNYQGASFH